MSTTRSLSKTIKYCLALNFTVHRSPWISYITFTSLHTRCAPRIFVVRFLLHIFPTHVEHKDHHNFQSTEIHRPSSTLDAPLYLYLIRHFECDLVSYYHSPDTSKIFMWHKKQYQQNRHYHGIRNHLPTFSTDTFHCFSDIIHLECVFQFPYIFIPYSFSHPAHQIYISISMSTFQSVLAPVITKSPSNTPRRIHILDWTNSIPSLPTKSHKNILTDTIQCHTRHRTRTFSYLPYETKSIPLLHSLTKPCAPNHLHATMHPTSTPTSQQAYIQGIITWSACASITLL